ncbi:MAG: regulatory iron-sulfur-containing complex subunit RicT [Eggerthellaceae bacterium]|jgi:cell fate regulator YaaT (PSP1 superfamily)
MALVASVRLPFDPRTRWFDPKDLEIHSGDDLIVRTTRGVEYGVSVGEVAEVDDLQVKNLRSPLQPVLRLATDADRMQRDEMQRLSDEAFPVFKRLAAQTNEDMHPIKVQYLFDGNKAVFLFEAEERTDFRELVRRLSSELHIHVDMRQIGVRDEARIIGGIGHCGQELCCSRIGGEICPVSIKMAKAQDLSLNPQQISGVCGRLMCCLRYEYEAYKDFKARAPKNNATIKTPEGDFKVCQLDTPHEVVVLRTDEGKRVRIPLSAFDAPDPDAESQRPRSIGEAYYEYANAVSAGPHSGMVVGSTERFTGHDKLAEKGAIHRNPANRDKSPSSSEEGNAHRRSRRRRRSARGGQEREGNGRSPRHTEARGQDSRPSGNRNHQGKDAKSEGRGSAHRRSRNRNHSVSQAKGGQRGELARSNKTGTAIAQTDSRKAIEKSDKSKRQNNRNRGGSSKKQDPRKSSNVRVQNSGSGTDNGSGSNGKAHRRSRRRSHKMGGADDAQ